MGIGKTPVKVIKRNEAATMNGSRRIRPGVIRKLLLDEKANLMRRVQEINRELQKV